MKFPRWWWIIFVLLVALYIASVAIALSGAGEMRRQAGEAYVRISAIPDQQMTSEDGYWLNFSKRMMVFAVLAGIWLVPSIVLFLFFTISVAFRRKRSHESRQ